MIHRLLPILLLLAGCAANRASHPAADADAPRIPDIITPAAAQPQVPLDDHVPGVRTFGFISADVWRGAKPTPDGLKTLAAMGVKTIIDLQQVDESADVPPGVRYVPMRVSSWHCDQLDPALFLRTLADCPKPVFVHCLEGRDRTGLAIGAYRLASGMKVETVIAELNAFRVNPWWRGLIEERIRSIAKQAPMAAKTEKIPM